MTTNSITTWTRPGRFFCRTHAYVITSGMAGCPRCIADQTDPEALP